jgi:uncharacterized protein YyaL (SSP411 family)
VIIAVAAFGLKMASRYLPERMPNQLAGQYGEYVLRSKRQTVHWFPFGTAAFGAAKNEGKVIVLDVGTTVSLAAKSFSEDYATDEEYRRLLHDHFIAVKVDALEIPWLVDAMSLESESFASIGRFALVAMDADGAILATSELKPRSGDQSLAAWLEEIARLRYSNRSVLESRAVASRRRRLANATAKLSHGSAGDDYVDTWSIPYEQAALNGNLAQAQLPVGTQLMQVLTGTPRSEAWGSGLSFMLGLVESPSFDCIEGGFFIMSMDARWQQPVTSKMPGHSLQVAAAYAEAAYRFDLPLFRWVARKTALWALDMRVDGIFAAAESTDQISGRSERFSLSEADVEQMPINVDSDGLPSIAGATSFAAGVSEQHTQAIADASAKLRVIRKAKPGTRIDQKTYANLNGQAIAGLFRIGNALGDPDLYGAASEAFAKAREAFVLPLGDVRHAPDGIGKRNGYAPDYAWIVRAAIDGYFATGDQELLDDAERIAERMLELFQGEEGAIASYLPSLLDEVGFGFPVYRSTDTELPGVNAVAAMALSDLAALTGKTKYRQAAMDIVRAFSGAFSDEAAPLGMVLAGRGLYDPIVLIDRSNPPDLGALREAAAPVGRFSRPGLYLATSQRAEGPLTVAEVRARLSKR